MSGDGEMDSDGISTALHTESMVQNRTDWKHSGRERWKRAVKEGCGSPVRCERGPNQDIALLQQQQQQHWPAATGQQQLANTNWKSAVGEGPWSGGGWGAKRNQKKTKEERRASHMHIYHRSCPSIHPSIQKDGSAIAIGMCACWCVLCERGGKGMSR